MFGYVKPYTPELRMREHEAYRGLYCGLCRAMGKVTGQGSRMTLNYEFVFLAAVRMILKGEAPRFKKSRCAVHPIKPRAIAESSQELEYAAGVSALLAYSKLQDDISDERGMKKLAAVMLKPYFSHSAKLAGKRQGAFSEDALSVMSNALSSLASLEKGKSESIDDCAETFAGITAHIFSAGLGETHSRIAAEIGRSVGRFIYLADALDDLADDAKKGSFNPILSLYGDGAVDKRDGKIYLSPGVCEAVTTGALCDLQRLGAAVELACDGGDSTLDAIIKNTVYLGLPKVLEDIIKRHTEDKQNSK